MKNLSAADSTTVSKGFLTVILLIGSVLLSFWGLRTGNTYLMLSVVMVPFLPLLMSRLDLLVIMMVVLDASAMLFAGLSGITYGMFPRLIIIFTVLLAGIVTKKQSYERFPEKRPLFLFAFIIFILMAVRGTGLRFFGSEMWGGTIYVFFLISISFAVASPRIRISEKSIVWMA